MTKTLFRPGTRVRLTHEIALFPEGSTGKVERVPAEVLGPFDVAVRLTGRRWATRFYAHEVEPA